MDLESNLAMIENVEFEEKVDIDDLVLPPKPIVLAEIEVSDIKQEPIVEKNQHAAYESDLDVKKTFQLKLEENILNLYKELDMEKSESSRMDFSQRIQSKIREFARKISAQYDSVDHQMLTEIVLLKTKIVEITNEHKIAMSLNAKTMNSIVKMHEKAFEEKTNELVNIKEELQKVKVTNEELLQEIQALKMNKPNFSTNDSLEKFQEIKPFTCKYCEKSFLHIHGVKKHVKIHHATISKASMKARISIGGQNFDSNDNQNKVKSLRKNLKNDQLSICNSGLPLNLTDSKKKKTLEDPALKINLRKRKLLQENDEHSKKQEGQFVCENCNKMFSSKKGVKRHIFRVHENQNAFECKSCDYVSSDKSNFERHVRSVHDKQKPLNVHKCEYCNYDSINKSNIEKHVKSIHEKQKPSNVFNCKYCDFDSVHRSNIERHVKSMHDKQKPLNVIKCEFCDYTCRDKNNLARHIKSKHEK